VHIVLKCAAHACDCQQLCCIRIDIACNRRPQLSGHLRPLDDLGCRLRRQKWAASEEAGIKYFAHERVVIRYTVGAASFSLA
jgi:hypothetical protein